MKKNFFAAFILILVGIAIILASADVSFPVSFCGAGNNGCLKTLQSRRHDSFAGGALYDCQRFSSRYL